MDAPGFVLIFIEFDVIMCCNRDNVILLNSTNFIRSSIGIEWNGEEIDLYKL